MCLCCPSISTKYSYSRPENIMTGLWNIGRVYLVVWDTIHPSTSRLGMLSLITTVTLPYTKGHTLASCGYIKLWTTFLWTSLGFVVVIEQIMNATDYLNITVDHLNNFMLSVFQNGNGSLCAWNVPCHVTRFVLDWFQEHNIQFQLLEKRKDFLKAEKTL